MPGPESAERERDSSGTPQGGARAGDSRTSPRTRITRLFRAAGRALFRWNGSGTTDPRGRQKGRRGRGKDVMGKGPRLRFRKPQGPK